MPVHVLGVGAPPGSGKSTLFRALFAKALKTKATKVGLNKQQFKAHLTLVRGTPLYILGDYAHPTAGGTDKLSMGVAPRVVAFLNSLNEQGGTNLVVFEGDRLFGRKTLDEITEVVESVSWMILQPTEEALEERRDKRGSGQGGTWLKGRETKITKLAEWDETTCYPFTTDEEVDAVKGAIKEWLRDSLAS